MKNSSGRVLTLLSALLLFMCNVAHGQTSDAAGEFWPKLTVSLDLPHRMRIQGYVEKHDGEDFDFTQHKYGGMFSYRAKRIVKGLLTDIDEENQYNLVVGTGYEYLHTDQSGSSKKEHRVFVEVSPKYLLPAGFLLQDRNRNEFRWVNDAYNFRYRNKLTVSRDFKISKFGFVPFASGELFWDRNRHKWNENQYSFGVQIPYKKVFMVDVHYLRQNCTTCNPDPLNVLGVSLNFFFKKWK